MTARVIGGPVLPWGGDVLCRGTLFHALFVDRVVEVEGERFLLIHPAVDMEEGRVDGVCVAMKGAAMVMRVGSLLASTQGGVSVRWRKGLAEELNEEEASLILSWHGGEPCGPVIVPSRVPLWEGVVVMGIEVFPEPPVEGVEDRVWFWFSPYIVDEDGDMNVLTPHDGRFPFPLANAVFLATIASGRVVVDGRFVDVDDVVRALRGVYEEIYGAEVRKRKAVQDGEEGHNHRL